jgi:Fe2+ or Zn2+ uptake regulation protein
MTEEKEVFHRRLKDAGAKGASQRDMILKVFLEVGGHLRNLSGSEPRDE